jgi:hypothetical protein
MIKVEDKTKGSIHFRSSFITRSTLQLCVSISLRNTPARNNMKYKNQSAVRKLCDVYLKGVPPVVTKPNVFPRMALFSAHVSESDILIKLFHLMNLHHSFFLRRKQKSSTRGNILLNAERNRLSAACQGTVPPLM